MRLNQDLQVKQKFDDVWNPRGFTRKFGPGKHFEGGVALNILEDLDSCVTRADIWAIAHFLHALII